MQFSSVFSIVALSLIELSLHSWNYLRALRSWSLCVLGNLSSTSGTKYWRPSQDINKLAAENEAQAE